MKNILITGCSSGIGEQTAIYLKSKGYRVFTTVRDDNSYKRFVSLGFDTFYIDVTDSYKISEMFDFILSRVDTIDVIFNNAGYGQPGALEDISIDTLKEQFETNVFALHEITIQAIKIMRKQGYGKIIQHSSVLGLVSLRFRGAYNSSKYAIEGLSDTLRQELDGSGIYISLLNTGPVTSDFRKNATQKLIDNVDIEGSIYKDIYKENISKKKSEVPFNLEAIEVSKIVEKIITTNKPKPRYYITKATYILGFLKRVLPTKTLDKILYKI
jgi:short-subunit dehydrogenase